jgi:glycogen operon protein
MHVDGFRFDLAPVITHPGDPPARNEAFFSAMEEDPLLKNTKIIIEPWHLRSNQMGHYPAGWGEWNDHYRNTIRRSLRGDEGQARDLSRRIMGSPETYTRHGRHVFESINFITAHDGFTLYDLFSYNHKHNEANKEHNRDGTDGNFSWNCGIEGHTEDKDVLRLRKQMIKNAYCHLLFSFGTPMMLGGDEFLRTQQGNNNAYCQDNEITWFNWDLLEENHDIFEFVKKAIAFRKQHKILTHRKSLPNGRPNTDHWPDATWYSSHLGQPDWHDPACRLLCLHLDGQKSVFNHDSQIFFIFNTGFDPIEVRLPTFDPGIWHRIIDTSLEHPEDSMVYDEHKGVAQGTTYLSQPRSVVVLSGKS